MMRVLFVDDEPRILEGLEVSLRKLRRRWTMEFALGGESALERIGSSRFDVVVTDMRMPGVDGLAVLRHLEQHHPATVRVVLSGEHARGTALEVAPYVHQSLTKPCRPAELEAVLERTVPLRALVGDPSLRRMLNSIRELPPQPRTYAALVAALADERAGLREVAQIIVADIALSAKILKFANSAFFGVGRAVKTVADAVTLLGVEAVKAFTLTAAVFDAARLPPATRALADRLHEHSLLIATLALDLAGDARREAFATAMLHDVGAMVLATRGPGADTTLDDALHAKIGAYLLALWGLPAAVVDAVATHHDTPTDLSSPVARAIWEAERLVTQVAGDDAPTPAQRGEIQRFVLARGAELSAEQKERTP